MYVLYTIVASLVSFLVLKWLKKRRYCTDLKRLDGKTVLITGKLTCCALPFSCTCLHRIYRLSLVCLPVWCVKSRLKLFQSDTVDCITAVCLKPPASRENNTVQLYGFSPSSSSSRWELWHWQGHSRCLGNERRPRHHRLQRCGQGWESCEGDQVQESLPERLSHGAGSGQPAVCKRVLQELPPEGEEARHPDQQCRWEKCKISLSDSTFFFV